MNGSASQSRWRKRLADVLGEQVSFDEPLAARVAFRIGGPADALARPMTPEALAQLLTIAREESIAVTVLGTGSNVLVADRGIRGIVVRLAGELADIHVAPGEESAEVEVGAGALNAQLVALVLRLGFVGIEFLATVPGTFGGALIMNAGAHGGEIAGSVREVKLVDQQLRVVVRSRAECGFAYRTSAFLPSEVLTGAILDVPRGDARAAREHLQHMRDARRRTQPIGLPNAGSIFKNPPGDYAGRLIEAAGLKGQAIGSARISELHANFIVNDGAATANDVARLARLAQETVRSRFGVELEWEVKRIGDWAGAPPD